MVSDGEDRAQEFPPRTEEICEGKGGRCGGQTEEGSTHFVGISGETRRERTIIEEEIKEFSPPLEFCKVPQGAFYTKT